jgi:exodeoxyribonuclease VII large subunit
VIVARGGGTLADLFAFCDETLCRTVAMLRVPVLSSVGHHTDRTLIDDVAALACSTPTHAAEAAVPLHCGEAHAALERLAVRLERQSRRAIVERARSLARLSRAPAQHVERHRARLHQQLRELRAATRRTVGTGRQVTTLRAGRLERAAGAAAVGRGRAAERARSDAAALDRAAAAASERRRRDLERLAMALTAHDPQRTLERGYALVEGPDGEPVTSAGAAAAAPELALRLHDGRVRVRPEGGVASEGP